MVGWPSGLRRMFGEHVGETPPGFESQSHRQCSISAVGAIAFLIFVRGMFIQSRPRPAFSCYLAQFLVSFSRIN